MAMLFIIITQRKRRVEEIMYDTSAAGIEGVRQNMPSIRKNQHHRNEKLMRIIFVVYLAIRTFIGAGLCTFKLLCTNLMNTPPIYGDITLYLSLINIVIMMIIFTTLMYLMRKYHHFEYNRSKNLLIINYVLEICTYTFSIFSDSSQRHDIDLGPIEATIYLMNIPQILLSIAIYKYKTNSDVL